MLDLEKQNRVSDEVIHSVDNLINIDERDIDQLIRLASSNKRKRIRFCAHKSHLDDVHEMLIVHSFRSYVRPHLHLNKIESMLVLKGDVDYVLFDDNGKVGQVIQMGELKSGKQFYNSIRNEIYHTLFIRSEWLVFLEITKGPFDKRDTVFPNWCPKEEDSLIVEKYQKNLEKEIDDGSLHT